MIGWTNGRTRALVVRTALAAVALAVTLPATLTAQAFPPEPPAPAPLEPARFPAVEESRLQNGLDVAVVERASVPIASISLTFPAGPAFDPEGLEGAAQVLADVITRGTPEHTGAEIAARIENLGGQIGVGADQDNITIFVTILARHADVAFEVLGDIARDASLPEREVQVARARLTDGLRVARSQPRVLGTLVLAQTLYGDHPYGRLASPESVARLERAHLLDFRDRHVRPEHGLLVVTGGLSDRSVRTLARRHLGGSWGRPDAPLPGRPQATPTANRPEDGILLVHRPGSTQSVVMAGNLLPPAGASPRYALTVANSILGGGAESRLFAILREQKGWTYGAYSDLQSGVGPGMFSAGAQVRTEVTDSALAELLRQVERMRDEPVGDAELEQTRAKLTGAFPLTVQTVAQLNAQVRSLLTRGRSVETLNEYRTRIGAVGPADITAAAEAHLRPDRGAVVVVGDATRILDPLRRIAPVRVVDPQGQPVDAAALVAP